MTIIPSETSLQIKVAAVIFGDATALVRPEAIADEFKLRSEYVAELKTWCDALLPVSAMRSGERRQGFADLAARAKAANKPNPTNPNIKNERQMVQDRMASVFKQVSELPDEKIGPVVAMLQSNCDASMLQGRRAGQ